MRAIKINKLAVKHKLGSVKGVTLNRNNLRVKARMHRIFRLLGHSDLHVDPGDLEN